MSVTVWASRPDKNSTLGREYRDNGGTDGRMGAGRIAGLVIGVVAALLLAQVAFYFLCWKRRIKRAEGRGARGQRGEKDPRRLSRIRTTSDMCVGESRARMSLCAVHVVGEMRPGAHSQGPSSVRAIPVYCARRLFDRLHPVPGQQHARPTDETSRWAFRRWRRCFRRRRSHVRHGRV